MKDNLRVKTLGGIKWNSISKIFNTAMQLLYTGIMARLLVPENFGLIAMAQVFLTFGYYFSHLGLGQALVQKTRISNLEIRSVFTLSFFLGGIFFVVCWSMSPVAAVYFKNPTLSPIIRVLGLSFIINGISLTSINLLRRELRFKVISIIEMISYFTGYLVIGVSLAIAGYGVWSLIFANLSRLMIVAVLSYWSVKHNLLFICQFKELKPILSYGYKISIIGFIEYSYGYLDTFFIGRFLGERKLGFYNRASMTANLPTQYLISVFSRVFFPAFSQKQKDLVKLKNVYLFAVCVFSILLCPMCAYLSFFSKPVVLIVLGEKWTSSINILRILAFVPVFDLIAHVGGIVCDATAFLRKKMKLQFTVLLSLIILIVVLYPYGLKGIAFAGLFSHLYQFIGFFYLTMKVLRINAKELSRVFFPGVFMALCVSIISFFLFSFEFYSQGGAIFQTLTGIPLVICICYVLFLYQPGNYFRNHINHFLDLKTFRFPWLLKLLRVNPDNKSVQS